MRDNEIGASSVGVRVGRTRRTVFLVAALGTAAAGGLLAVSQLYTDLLDGTVIRPHPLALGDGFVRVDRMVPLIDIGFATASLAGDRVVRDLDPVSNAASAGLRDGDRIVDGLSFAELEAAPDRTMRLRVERPDATVVDIAYRVSPRLWA